MTLDESVHGMRLRVIERACRCSATSAPSAASWGSPGRSSIGGANGWNAMGSTACTHAGSAAERGARSATPPEVERLVLGIAISAATWGCRRIAAYLARTWQSPRRP